MNTMLRKFVNLFDTVQEGVKDKIDFRALSRHSIKGNKVLLKLVDENELTMWQRGMRTVKGVTENLPRLKNKDADIITWARPGILLALAKGQIKRVDGKYYPYDIKDALLKREVKYNSKRPIGGDLKNLIDMWEAHIDEMATVLIEKGIYTTKDFGGNVLKRLSKKGYIL